LVAVTLISAQATLRRPATVDYTISSQVTAGYLHVGIPQAGGAARAIAVRTSSGGLELRPR
jgi:hypothetical protein